MTSISVLIGGFLLRYGIVNTAPELLAKSSPELVKMTERHPVGGIAFPWRFSPEEGRVPGQSLGADPGNKVGAVVPRSKVAKSE